MLFSTYDFIFLFLPLAVALRVAFWDSRFIQAPFAALVLLSLLFYGWWNPANLWIIIASILFNYLLGVLVQKHHEPLLVVFGIAANLVFLGFFKYRNFVIENISLTAGFESAPTSLIIPLGISFFTFHQIAWLIESHQGRTKSRDFLRYCLFITFFPQLIAGPILRPSELIPQFDSRGDGKPLREHLAVGFSIFLRDYLYIPLGGNAAHSHANLLATMLLGGLWHGANWTFLDYAGFIAETKKALTQIAAETGIEYFDYLDGASAGITDREFMDSIHPGEPAVARLLLGMSVQSERLRSALDLPKLQQIVHDNARKPAARQDFYTRFGVTALE